MDEQLQFASDGTGPLLQRDYWAVIHDCRIHPQEIIELLRSKFDQLAPEGLVRFISAARPNQPLSVGDLMEVKIRMTSEVKVRVVDISDLSLTIATVEGHPEAGKITFGAYHNDRGDVIFHIRSRARSSSALHFAGFLTAGDAMQTNTWTDFIDRLAHTVGDGVIGGQIFADKQEVDEQTEDADANTPTFIARAV